ncbi:hypothetical protein GW17_00052928 [Ensete ventricosum]|nr:hypothetical protein GW17_00052928 [Ensete ventricosum]
MHSCCIFAAKATRRRGGQPRPAPMQGRPPTARPVARGSLQQMRSPAGMVGAYRGGACGRRQRLRPGRRWRLSAARPQGAAPRPGLERNEEGQPCHLHGWLAMAKAPARAADYGLSPRMGGRTWPGPPARATARDQGCRQQAQPPATKATTSRRNHQRAWLAPTAVAATAE